MSVADGTDGATDFQRKETRDMTNNSLLIVDRNQYDTISGLYHADERDCDPVTMTWMQQDPMGYVDGMNRYQSMADNPIIFTDPQGLDTLTFGDGSPTTAPATAPATQPRGGTKEYAVNIPNGPSGKLIVTWSDQYSKIPAYKNITGANVTFTFVPDTNAKKCDSNLNWNQSLQSKVLNPEKFKPEDLATILAKEKADHGGADPFGNKPVGDNATGDSSKPYGSDAKGTTPKELQSVTPTDASNPQSSYSATLKDAPYLPVAPSPNAATMPNAAFWPAGVEVRKSFVTSLYNGDKALGLTITWETTQTAGDPSKTTLSGSVKWGG